MNKGDVNGTPCLIIKLRKQHSKDFCTRNPDVVVRELVLLSKNIIRLFEAFGDRLLAQNDYYFQRCFPCFSHFRSAVRYLKYELGKSWPAGALFVDEHYVYYHHCTCKIKDGFVIYRHHRMKAPVQGLIED